MIELVLCEDVQGGEEALPRRGSRKERADVNSAYYVPKNTVSGRNFSETLRHGQCQSHVFTYEGSKGLWAHVHLLLGVTMSVSLSRSLCNRRIQPC